MRIPLDLPTEQLVRAVGEWSEPALLTGGVDFGDAGRWSILAARPRLVFEAVDQRWTIRRDDGATEAGDDPLKRLESLAREYRLAEPSDRLADGADVCPFQGGMIGFFGYDLAPMLERLPRRTARTSRIPDVRFALYDAAVIVDERGVAAVHAWDLVGEGRWIVEARAESWHRDLQATIASPRPLERADLGPLTSGFTRDEYRAAVQRTLDYIAAGDVFQINLSQRFTATGRIDPLDFFLRLRRESPAPFSAFLQWDDLAVVSASPEWFYQTRGDWIATRPIKGTRPRGVTPEADAALAAELSASLKDRAELTMIVDLERNDLGRVCRYGSVKVVDPLTLESYAQVHHLVATVEGRLREGVGPIDVVRAAFPGGSITGAPKIRAMEIIDELETGRRSLYTGAIGYLGRCGASAFNIAIRTALVEGDCVSFQVGGGIVADSDPEAEYLETLHKGRGLRRVLTGEDQP